MNRSHRFALTVCLGLAAAPLARAQSLFERADQTQPSGQSAPAPARPSAPPGPPALAAVSLTAIEAPEPRVFTENDLVTIIVSERTRYDRSVETESEKKIRFRTDIKDFVDLLQLFELRVDPEGGVPVGVDLKTLNKFEGTGTFEHEDRMTDRITARVLEVKPNGTLVLEARRSVTTDDSEVVVTLSGLCRSEDITDSNTVQTNQLFDMRLDLQNSGELRRTTEKGLITRMLETIFNL